MIFFLKFALVILTTSVEWMLNILFWNAMGLCGVYPNGGAVQMVLLCAFMFGKGAAPKRDAFLPSNTNSF